jgi:uncharacterized membrane protein
MRILRRYFLAGLAVVLPTAVSVYVLWLLFVKLDGILGSYLAGRFGLRIPGIGLAAIVVILLLAGVMARNLIGKRLIGAVQKALEAIPLFNRVYTAMRQISEAFLNEESTTFRRVAAVEYPRPGMYSLCFVTAERSGEVEAKLGRRTVNVFLPTSPNPTSGYMLVVPVEDIIPLDMSVEEGMKMVISGGSYIPLGRRPGMPAGRAPLGGRA